MKNLSGMKHKIKALLSLELPDFLCSELLLQYYNFTKLFVIITAAFGYAIGSILSQGTIGKDLSVAYTSWLLNKTEQNYSTIEKELLAIVHGVQFLPPYIYGRKFTVRIINFRNVCIQ